MSTDGKRELLILLVEGMSLYLNLKVIKNSLPAYRFSLIIVSRAAKNIFLSGNLVKGENFLQSQIMLCKIQDISAMMC